MNAAIYVAGLLTVSVFPTTTGLIVGAALVVVGAARSIFKSIKEDFEYDVMCLQEHKRKDN